MNEFYYGIIILVMPEPGEIMTDQKCHVHTSLYANVSAFYDIRMMRHSDIKYRDMTYKRLQTYNESVELCCNTNETICVFTNIYLSKLSLFCIEF